MKRKLKQKQIAALVGVTPTHISQIFSGQRRPSPELAARLETVLKVNRDHWLYPDPVKNPYLKVKEPECPTNPEQ